MRDPMVKIDREFLWWGQAQRGAAATGSLKNMIPKCENANSKLSGRPRSTPRSFAPVGDNDGLWPDRRHAAPS